MTDFFKDILAIKFEGIDCDNEFAFRHYNAEEVVMGKPLKDHYVSPQPIGIRSHGSVAIHAGDRRLIAHGLAIQWIMSN